MRFLVDAQLPPALARMLASRGHVSEHVTDIGPGNATDRELWAYALDNSAVIITKDEDFSGMRLFESPAPAMIWVRIGNTRRAILLDVFDSVLDQLVVTIESGQEFVELR